MTGGSNEARSADEISGTLTTLVLPPGKIYPGTLHACLLYVPPVSEPDRPLPFTIFFDGIWGFAERMSTPAILDRLIAAGDVPPMAGIFLDPGVLPVPSAEMQARVNRHLEYDAITDRFSRFLIEELIPFVERYHPLSADPNDRGLAGLSSSAVAAAAAAWHRPDQFRRIFTSIGTFVDIAGEHVLPFWKQ
jgi:gluconolactonase